MGRPRAYRQRCIAQPGEGSLSWGAGQGRPRRPRRKRPRPRAQHRRRRRTTPAPGAGPQGQLAAGNTLGDRTHTRWGFAGGPVADNDTAALVAAIREVWSI
ncbi:hypothetical protein [Rhodococcus zopfii]|uniref:hypothetical protein n=1 Tax=Rhodococcus zopfii TaxID=43772 RepID=UPI0011148D13|nr:hypothetical protein [Rhodococcus zopfii]